MNRWVRLSAAVFVMVLIGNLQYAWTLFVKPFTDATGWKLSEVQWGFTFFIGLGTWVMPISGVLIDRLGPRAFIAASGALCGVGWGLMGYSRSLIEFYALYSIAGCGAAFVYCGALSIALKWFPDKRGLRPDWSQRDMDQALRFSIRYSRILSSRRATKALSFTRGSSRDC